jgi:glycosyltransferase involved in cell wall biosynthesis
VSRPPPPLVSVVVPAFQHADLIAECLRSVVAQTHEAIELIVVDDASRDGTADVVQRLFSDLSFAARFHDRLVLERRASNHGAHDAINLGIARATGEWVAILNSDDRYHPDRLAVLLAAAEGRGASFVFSGVSFIDRRGRDVTDSDEFAARLAETQAKIAARPSVGFALLPENVTISTGNFLFRRPLAALVGKFRPLRYCHDWDFALRCLLHAEPVFVEAPLYEYRLHETNSFRSLGDVAAADGFECLRNYFTAVRQSAFENWRAPGPTTWPLVFERFVAEHANLAWLWRATSGIRG